MSAKVDKALNRLKTILPLKDRQEQCSAPIKELHQNVLRSFVTRGRILSREEMAQYVDNLEEAIRVLTSHDMVVFSENGDPIGAYPFTMEAREHKVRVNGRQVYAMCALDALAVSPMFETKTQVNSICRITGDPVTIEQSGKTIENLDESGDIHFGIIWGAASDGACVADSLCMEMMFLLDNTVANQWLAEDLDNREIFTLPEAVEFNTRFFVPLMS